MGEYGFVQQVVILFRDVVFASDDHVELAVSGQLGLRDEFAGYVVYRTVQAVLSDQKEAELHIRWMVTTNINVGIRVSCDGYPHPTTTTDGSGLEICD